MSHNTKKSCASVAKKPSKTRIKQCYAIVRNAELQKKRNAMFDSRKNRPKHLKEMATEINRIKQYNDCEKKKSNPPKKLSDAKRRKGKAHQRNVEDVLCGKHVQIVSSITF